MRRPKVCRTTSSFAERAARQLPPAALSLALLALLALLAAPAHPGSTGTVQLHMPQGSGAGTAIGDYISADNGPIDGPYRYFAEVPPGTSRLVIDLFDADIGAGAGTEAAAGRDRQRGGSFNTSAAYRVFDPNGNEQPPRHVTGSNTLPAGSDNTWLTWFDTASPFFVSQSTATAGANVTSIAISTPANVITGDFLLALIANDGSTSSTAAIPANWVLVNEGNCNGGACRLEIYRRFVTAGEPASHTFNFDSGEQVVAAILAYRGVDTADPVPASAFGTGSTTTPTSPSVTPGAAVANALVVRAYAADGATTPTGSPGEHAPRFNLASSGGGGSVTAGAADRSFASAGATGAATFTISASQETRGATLVLRPSASRPAPHAGHWEIRVDQSNAVTTGDDINAFGLRAHDGDSGASGTEINVYYDSHAQIGINSEEGPDPNLRDYDLYPWITSGCFFSAATFDVDQGNGGGLGPSGRWGSLQMVRPDSTVVDPPVFPTPSVNHDAIVTTLSANDAWLRNQFSVWTSDNDALHYGIWRVDATISPYTPVGNSNYANLWFMNWLVGGTGAPAANPTANAFWTYLPTDAGGAPLKPYLEQMVRWFSGPNPPLVGQTSRFTVTVRLGNPTPHAITFSSPSNLVTTPLSGAAQIAYVGGSADVSVGSVTSQPANGASSGNIVWNPGSVPGGTLALLEFDVDVTPTVGGQRILVVATPAAPGTRAQYVDETGNTTQARATKPLGPLCELAVTENVATRALVTGLSAFADRGGVTVEWTTATEDGTAGFYLYRYDAVEGDWVDVGDLQPADPRTPHGALYRVVDPGADPHAELIYTLVEIERRGGASRGYGPFAVAVAPRGERLADVEAEPRVAAGRPVAELERLAAARREQERAAGVEQARIIGPPSVPPVKGGKSAAIKVFVRESGLHRLGIDELAATWGVPTGSVRGWIQSNQLRLEHRGLPVATLAAGDGTAIYFFGQPSDTRVSLDNVYWLRVGAGTPMAGAAVAAAQPGAVTTSLARLEVEQDVYDVTALSIPAGEDFWFWDFVIAGHPTFGTRSYPVQLAEADAAGPDGELTVRLHGASDSGVAGEHQVEARFNGASLGSTSFTGLTSHQATFPLPAALLGAGAGTIQLVGTAGPGAPTSELFVDGFEIVYPRFHRTGDGQIELAPAPGGTVVGGFRSGDVELFDLSQPRLPKRVSGATLGRGADGFELRFQGTAPRYLAASWSAAKPPAGLRLDVPSDLAGSPGAEYVVIAPSALAAGAQELAELRRRFGLSALVADLEDVYDEFGHGFADPAAIRAFLTWAHGHWSVPPRYAVLVGEGTYDYRDLLGIGGNLVPAPLLTTASGLYATDASFGDVDGDGLPEIAVGRIPVLTPAELEGYLLKLTLHETGATDASWRRSALLVADDADQGTDFRFASERLAERLPSAFDLTRLYLSETTPLALKTGLVAALNSGAAFVHYYGHGGLDRLADESLLTIGDLAALDHRDRTPFFAAMTCAINRYEIPGYPSLGEEMVRRARGGAVAVWSPAGLSGGGEATALAELLASAAFRAPSARLGDVLLETQGHFAVQGGSAEMLRLYLLLGDPALRLIPPQPEPVAPGPPSGGE